MSTPTQELINSKQKKAFCQKHVLLKSLPYLEHISFASHKINENTI